MMNACSKHTGLKWEKLVNRASMQFHKKSYTHLQQLSISPLDFTLLLKWVNYFPITQDCAAENLKNWHGMKERWPVAWDSSHQPEMFSVQTPASKLPLFVVSALFISVSCQRKLRQSAPIDIQKCLPHVIGEAHEFCLEMGALCRPSLFKVVLLEPEDP